MFAQNSVTLLRLDAICQMLEMEISDLVQQANSDVVQHISELSDADEKALRRRTHDTIAKVSDDIGRRYTFNTAIAAVMELANALSRFQPQGAQGRAVMQEGLETMVLLLAPIVPHITHVLWQALGHDGAVIDVTWPRPDESARRSDSQQLVVQVNGNCAAGSRWRLVRIGRQWRRPPWRRAMCSVSLRKKR